MKKIYAIGFVLGWGIAYCPAMDEVKKEENKHTEAIKGIVNDEIRTIKEYEALIADAYPAERKGEIKSNYHIIKYEAMIRELNGLLFKTPQSETDARKMIEQINEKYFPEDAGYSFS